MEENESFWLKDMIVLGHGAPNKVRSLKGQQGRCACIWSPSIGYCRIYPVPYGFLHDWDKVDVEVRKPSNDGRENTFIICNYENDWNRMYSHIKIHKNDDGSRFNFFKKNKQACIELVRELAKDSFSEIRDNKSSFGIIKPRKIEGHLKKNRETSTAQTTLTDLDELIMNQRDYKWVPYIEYSCSKKCSAKHPHKSKIVEWGCYQWMIKNPNDEEHCKKVFDNLGIGQEGWEHYLLIGNTRKWMKSYIIVKVIRFKTPKQK